MFYSGFVKELKATDPGKWYQMAKRIGAVENTNNGDVNKERSLLLNTLPQLLMNMLPLMYLYYLPTYQPLNHLK